MPNASAAKAAGRKSGSKSATTSNKSVKSSSAKQSRGKSEPINVPRTASTKVVEQKVVTSGDFDMRQVPPRTDVAHTTDLRGNAGDPLESEELEGEGVDPNEPETNPLSQSGRNPVGDSKMGAFASPQERDTINRVRKFRGDNVTGDFNAEKQRQRAQERRGGVPEAAVAPKDNPKP